MDNARTRECGTTEATAGTPPTRGREVIPVHLFEDAQGRLLVVDGRVGRPRPDAGPLLRIGRTRLALHRLAPAAAERLAAQGVVVVEGPDALNVLLALADASGRDRDGIVPG